MKSRALNMGLMLLPVGMALLVLGQLMAGPPGQTRYILLGGAIVVLLAALVLMLMALLSKPVARQPAATRPKD